MQTLRDIRRRIRSVESTRQIARAMEMVSAARLKRAQARLLSARPYAESMEGVVRKVCSAGEGVSHPFVSKRDVEAVAVCVIASDRGLCGAFNANVIRQAEEFAAQQGDVHVRFVPVGKKAAQHFGRREKGLKPCFPELGPFAEPAITKALTAELTRLYLEGEVQEVWMDFTHFISSGSRRVVLERLLPVELEGGEGTSEDYGYIYEPSADMLLGTLLPRYVEMKVFVRIAESCASEHSARMVAMSFATKNADDMIFDLTLLRNRARQSAITKEIADIVGTAEVLR
ncbi:MAG: ATP synthase F1 subunit gamma [Candidatus Eiseniibacteriota bacterium]|nr:MAG: ATP synthase F1 subunit gamma [Candidatus Eisenbacteria bacterium]